jgi:hypothetical protein
MSIAFMPRTVARSALAVSSALLLSSIGSTAHATPDRGHAQVSAPTTTAAASHHHPTLHNTCHKSHIDVPACGVLWGAFRPPEPVPGHTYWSQHYQQYENAIGRRFDIVKDYVDFAPGDTFPGHSSKKLAHKHHILYFSWNATSYDTGDPVSYTSIANGAWDHSVLRPEAHHLKHFHHKVFIDFNHEFDAAAEADNGSASQYVKAYRHIYHFMHKHGVHNIIWSWVSTGYLGNKHFIRNAYPGAKYVDWIGYDPYNFAFCTGKPWRSPHKTFHPFYHWTHHQHGRKHKPLLLSEYGSAPGSKVEHWYRSVAKALHHMHRIKAAMQFSAPTTENCDVSLADDSAAMTGFTHSSLARPVLGRKH